MTDLSFVEEEIPTITRAGGSGAQPVEWEKLLAPLTEGDKAGKSFRVWQYEKKTGATSRVAAVRNRLTAFVPEQNWKIAVRAVPGSDPEVFGVYVQYDGTFTPEEVAKRAEDRAARVAKIQAARAAASASNATLDGNTEDSTSAEAPSTPAAKVAAAKAKASAK